MDDTTAPAAPSPSSYTNATRWRILTRDRFTCQYCGRTPQDAIGLHVDHIIPVSIGGWNGDENLTASCQACNLSKRNKPLPLPAHIAEQVTRTPRRIFAPQGPEDVKRYLGMLDYWRDCGQSVAPFDLRLLSPIVLHTFLRESRSLVTALYPFTGCAFWHVIEDGQPLTLREVELGSGSAAGVFVKTCSACVDGVCMYQDGREDADVRPVIPAPGATRLSDLVGLGVKVGRNG